MIEGPENGRQTDRRPHVSHSAPELRPAAFDSDGLWAFRIPDELLRAGDPGHDEAGLPDTLFGHPARSATSCGAAPIAGYGCRSGRRSTFRALSPVNGLL